MKTQTIGLLIAGATVSVVDGQCATGTYYSTATRNAFNSQTGTTLTNTIHNLIDGHTVLPYTSSSTDVWDALKSLDSDGSNGGSQVRLVYENTLISRDATNGDGQTGTWNREHTWPRSYGVDSSGPDNTDIHHIRASDTTVNSLRGNLPFDWCVSSECSTPGASDTGRASDRFMPPARFRGDIARGLFYMAARYDGSDGSTMNLMLSDCPNAAQGRMGYLTTLLRWHNEDPVSAEERRRNDRACSFQGNRNPFVDFPELVARVYDSYNDPGGSSCAPTAPSPGGSNPTPFPTVAGPSPTPFPTTGGGGGGGSIAAGDLAFVGFNSDNADGFALVATRSIASGTTIYVTDNAWTGSSFATNEGTISRTLGATSAGDIIQGPSGWSVVSGQFALSTSSDTMLVFSGSTSSPQFIAGVTYSSAGWASSSSLLPSSLSVGSTAVTLPHQDNYIYTGTTSGSRSTVLANINTYSSARWTGSSSTRYSFSGFNFNFNSLGLEAIQDESSPVALIAGISGGVFLVAFAAFFAVRQKSKPSTETRMASASSLATTNPKFAQEAQQDEPVVAIEVTEETEHSN